MVTQCLFCDIAAGRAKADRVWDDKNLVVVEDINPQAPTHLLIIPKKHIEGPAHIEAEDVELIGEVFLVAKRLARERGVEGSGYRIVVNCNRDAGQSIFHLHYHLLGGRVLGWPPG